jgi:hypothetical protein
MTMEKTVYDRQFWRELPRDGECVVRFLFEEAAGPCRGLITRHHVDPEDPESRSFQVCIKHHNRVQTALRRLLDPPRWRRCPHKPGTHRYQSGKEACERELNRDLITEISDAA